MLCLHGASSSVSSVSLWKMRLVLRVSLPFIPCRFLPFYFFSISNSLSVNTSALCNYAFYLFLVLIKAYLKVVNPSLSLPSAR